MRKLTNSLTRVKTNTIGFWGIPRTGGAVDGYSYAGLGLIMAMQRAGFKTPWRDESSPVSLSFAQPEFYSQVPGQYRIGYTPWESTKMMDHWIPLINEMDEFWTTSNFCADVFKDNGVEIPIQVVHHGINKNEWSLKKRVIRDKLVFLHIGEPAERKGGQMVVDAFIDTFKNNYDVHLVMKANGYSTARMKEPFGPVDQHQRITLITDVYNVHEMNALYHKAHCLIYPSNGEGFGLIPFQSIATGMPTIQPNWGGLSDFGKWAIPMDYTVGPSGHGWHLGDWAFPSYDSLCEKMMYVYENYSSLAEKSYQNAIELREEFDWDAIVSRAFKGFL